MLVVIVVVAKWAENGIKKIQLFFREINYTRKKKENFHGFHFFREIDFTKKQLHFFSNCNPRIVHLRIQPIKIGTTRYTTTTRCRRSYTKTSWPIMPSKDTAATGMR